jgi:hypothetical protein
VRHPRPVGFLAETAAESASVLDPALQAVFGGTAVPVTGGLNFLGLGAGFPNYAICCAPPDTNAAVGTTQVVEAVNLSLEVFNKSTGAAVFGPTLLSIALATIAKTDL